MARTDVMLAAIDVGSNATRLLIGRGWGGAADTIERVLTERDPIRPGEDVFRSGAMSDATIDRLVDTLRRYARLCARADARVRAVATSAVRSATNQAEVLRRVRAGTGLELEVLSGEDEARLVCLGVLGGRSGGRAAVLDIGGGSTEVAAARGDTPTHLWTAPLGAVRLAERFGSAAPLAPAELAALRSHAAGLARAVLPAGLPGRLRRAFAASGTLRAVIRFAAAGAGRTVSARQVSAAVHALAAMDSAGRLARFEPRRADLIVAGAAALEAVMQTLDLAEVTATERGLRDGVLASLAREVSFRPSAPRAVPIVSSRF